MTATRARRARRAVHPALVAAALRELRPRAARSDGEHLTATIDWLRAAHDAAGRGGVSATFDLASGWQPPYPETTGYIVATLLWHRDIDGDDQSWDRAQAMGEWLLTIQAGDGSFTTGPHVVERRPQVFDTGQVLFALTGLASTTGDDRFAAAAHRCARWLVAQQDAAGCWTTFTVSDAPHAYDSRVAWALAAAGRVLDEPAYTAAARRAVDWVCAQQRDTGWFDCAAFLPGTAPLTHTLGYTIEGLLETSLVQPDAERGWNAAVDALSALERAYGRPGNGVRLRRAGQLAATLGPDWTSSDRYACVTGSLQIALCCQRVDAVESRPELRGFADALLTASKTAQPIEPTRVGVHGGIPGSSPLWGRYGSFRYINWGAKFMADVLLDRRACGRPRYG